ncbi:hypothetical protein Tco_0763137 [Tanacetum coccineum]
MRSILGSFFQNQASTSGTLPSNTIPNPKGEMKAITTRSGATLAGPSVPPPSPTKEVDREPETKTDQELTESTNNVPPPVVQSITDSTKLPPAPISSPNVVSPGLSSSCSTSGSLTWDSSGCLGWIVMALIELWICVKHCGSIIVSSLKRVHAVEKMISMDVVGIFQKIYVVEFCGPSRGEEFEQGTDCRSSYEDMETLLEAFKPIASLIA